MLFSLVSSGTRGLEHSHGLKVHNFTGSWSQYSSLVIPDEWPSTCGVLQA